MQDTIAAAATGGGVCAIGIIRISGPGAISAAARVFRARGGVSMTDAANRRLYYGELLSKDGDVIDVCMCTVSRAPGSYTGEDTAELHCHGSPVVLSEGLRALLSCGVRQALPGEFTRRAFLSGKMDLSQAEAVIDLIEAETPLIAKNAAGQLTGAVRERTEGVYGALLDILAHFHALIDYPDEDIDDFDAMGYLGAISASRNTLSRMLGTFERGRVFKDGVRTAIIGRPNVGKSSLLNALVGYERAIVTSVPGTTRDTIEEKLLIGGVPLRLIDTAGIRDTPDAVERLGVTRAYDALSRAELALIVLDGSQPLGADDRAILDAASGVRIIAIVNKSDLPRETGEPDMRELEGRAASVVSVSAVTGDGLDALEAEVARLFPVPVTEKAGEMITNARQADALSRAVRHLDDAALAIKSGITPDAALIELEAALTALGEITGGTLRDDATARIFERFCVGK